MMLGERPCTGLSSLGVIPLRVRSTIQISDSQVLQRQIGTYQNLISCETYDSLVSCFHVAPAKCCQFIENSLPIKVGRLRRPRMTICQAKRLKFLIDRHWQYREEGGSLPRKQNSGRARLSDVQYLKIMRNEVLASKTQTHAVRLAIEFGPLTMNCIF